jgi:hypothetical protein
MSRGPGVVQRRLIAAFHEPGRRLLLGDVGANQEPMRGEDFWRGLCVDQARVLARGLVEPFCVAERRVELANSNAVGSSLTNEPINIS